MKIAIISDVHGNITALEEVIKDVKKRKCDVILCLGDYLGYYYWPNQVIDALRSFECIYFIRGNHEDMYFRASKDMAFRKQLIQKYGHGIEVALSEMSDENNRFLLSLDADRVLVLDGIKIGMYHGSQSGISDYVYPDVGLAKLDQVMRTEVDVVLLGHTHHQFVSFCRNKLLINPGSVGQARDVRGLAAYTIFNTKNYSVTPIRLDYDKSKIINIIQENELNVDMMLKALNGGDQ